MDSLEQVKQNIKWIGEKFDECKDTDDTFTLSLIEDTAREIMISKYAYYLSRLEYHIVKSIYYHFTTLRRKEREKEKKYTFSQY